MKQVILLAALLAFPLSTIAQDGPPLTEARAKSFVACLADMIELEEKWAEDESMYEEEDEEEFEDWASMIAAMEAHPAYDDMMATLGKHGFEDAEDWAETSARFFSAYTSVKMGEQQVDMDAEMQKAIDAISENEMLSDEQKDEMIEMMKAQQQVYDSFQRDVSEAEKEAVRSVLEEFEALTMEEDEWDEEF